MHVKNFFLKKYSKKLSLCNSKRKFIFKSLPFHSQLSYPGSFSGQFRVNFGWILGLFRVISQFWLGNNNVAKVWAYFERGVNAHLIFGGWEGVKTEKITPILPIIFCKFIFFRWLRDASMFRFKINELFDAFNKHF